VDKTLLQPSVDGMKLLSIISLGICSRIEVAFSYCGMSLQRKFRNGIEEGGVLKTLK
jgi:hypothetical protein